MAGETDLCDCPPCRGGFVGSFAGQAHPVGSRPPAAERRDTSEESARGVPRFEQMRRSRRQETARTPRNVRALSEWAVPAIENASSKLGSRRTFGGKLEALGLGQNLFGTIGSGRAQQRAQPFLNCSLHRAEANSSSVSR